ncbi:Type I Iterative PKS [Clathrus columnatus]|uniref:Type I Iterative PKS n=1 Tax=Clathrus columnatus TaxID=1419009 RepID=A0AAV5AAL0_9AGAM|nr:Type I Iterative PKS [Clathrus columnatus]
MSANNNIPIAIIGVSAELPSGVDNHNLDYDAFWPFLLRKGEAYSQIPSDRFNAEAFSNLITPKLGTFLTRPTLFDPVEFGISANDALTLPVGTRKLIEHSFLALRDAGIKYRGSRIGVYAAAVNHDAGVLAEVDPYAITGSFANIPAMVANRISYHLDLQGPSLPLDTACSSSLTATHVAVQALQVGECDAAVVGGAQINLRLNEWIQYSQAGVLSKDGKSKPFDASADGFSRGEGVACIVLKPLDKAIRDGDRVYATILASAINSAGSQGPLNAPVAAAQQAAMMRAYEISGRNPSEVDFVEMHATGTAAGDPTEANWVGEQFKHQDGSPLLAGSVKGNLGHLEITAFLASLLKATHIIEHQLIPPTANFVIPNRRILWDEFNLHVPSTTPIPFMPRDPSGRALISLSSFGIGGANGHIVLEGPPSRAQEHNLSDNIDHVLPETLLIMGGGLTPRSAAAMAESLQDVFLTASPSDIPLLTKLAGRQAQQLTWRSFALYAPSSGTKSITFCEPQLAPRTRPPLAFVFSGQGPQHALMGRQLFARYRAFRESIYECDEAYRNIMGFSLLESSGLFVAPREGAEPSKPTISSEWTVTLPALTILQIGIFDLLASVGVRPDVVLGHSAGETALLYASGAAPKQMAIEVAIARAKMMSVAETVGGGMAAVSCSEMEAQLLIDEVLAKEGIFEQSQREYSLVLACYNAPDGVSVAGLVDLVDKLCSLAEMRGILARRLRIPVPVHSYLMDVCKNECDTLVGEVFTRYPDITAPTTTMYSTVTGTKWEQPFSVDYLWRNARQAVLFNQVTSQLVEEYPNMCYVEISPHPVLSSYISSAGVDNSKISCPARRPAKSGEFLEGNAFLESLGRLAMNGIDVDFDALNSHPTWNPNVKLPVYPFNKKDIAFNSDSSAFHRLLQGGDGPLNHPRLRINTKTHPSLAGHIINEEPIMPAAGFIEMGLEFGARTLSEVEFLAALPLSSEVPATVEIALDGARWTVKTSTALGHGSDKTWVLRGTPDFDRIHSRGLLSFDADDTDDIPLNLIQIQERCPRVARVEDLYDHGFKGFTSYGDDFKRIISCVQGKDECLAFLRGSEGLPESGKYRFDPVVLDAVFHGTMFFIIEHEQVILDYETRDYFLPSRTARVTVHDALINDGLPEEVAAHFVLKEWTPEGVSVDIFIVDITGRRLCTLRNFEMARHSNSVQKGIERRFQLEWQPLAIPVRTGDEQCYIRPLEKNTRMLWETLDAIAIDTIKNTLAESVVVGGERHRQRYWEFSKKASLLPKNEDALSAERVAALREAYPTYFSVTERFSKVHADVFTSTSATVQALYSNVETMQNFYGTENSVLPSCHESASIFRNLLTELKAAGKKAIRVLEVGCGTGMLTRHLVEVLEEFSDLVVEYVATDISLGLAMQAVQRFSHPYMRAAAYDLTKPLQEQGISPASFDIVTALHVLHATSNLTTTMTSISNLLVPGGYVLTVDFDGEAWQTDGPGTIWYDFFFGGFQEWFDYNDDRETHCTISLPAWRSLLTGTGFQPIIFSGSPPEEDHSLVFLVQKNDVVSSLLSDQTNGESTVDTGSQWAIGSGRSNFVFTYVCGEEMALRDALVDFDPTESSSIWICAADGSDGSAARGLVRTLSKEFPVWDLHLVIFHPKLSQAQRSDVLLQLQQRSSCESEISVDESGDVHIPRVVPLSSTNLEVPFDRNAHWIVVDGQPAHVALPPLGNYDVVVEVSHWSSLVTDTPRAFIGSVSHSNCADFTTGDYVMGLTNDSLSNRIVAHAGSIVKCEPNHLKLLWSLPGFVIAVLLLGPATLRRPGRLAAIQRVLVTDAHTAIGQAAISILHDFGLNVFAVGNGDSETLSRQLKMPTSRISTAKDALWVARQKGKYDIILSGAKEKSIIQVLSTLLSSSGASYYWNNDNHGLASSLKRDPWIVSLAIETVLQVVASDYRSPVNPIPINDSTPIEEGSPVVDRTLLFDPRKVYLLIGGIGGMGVQMALWMYENGARDIVLTSRRGIDTLHSSNQIASLRMVQHLENLPDLKLSLRAVDASNAIATSELIASLQKPIGGCFLMTMVLSDKSFTNQTKEDFEKVFASKTTAFRNLEQAIDINSLDFFVSFSSVAALFGSPGQSNYASAQTLLENLTGQYPNAFSLVVPGVTDSGWLVRDQRRENARSSHFLHWGMSTRELCDCLADGIRKLRIEPFTQYIPNLNWNLARQDMGPLTSFQHLCVTERAEVLTRDENEEKVDLGNLLRKALNVAEDDFLPNVPFTAYGLDSLIAVRLSASIRTQTGLKVTQLQLLADMTLEDLERRLEEMDLDFE